MIPKIIAGADFAGLLAYVAKPGHAILEPLGVDLDGFVAEMEMVASQSKRCTKPVKHVSFSAAKEDGRRSDAEWLELIDEAEHELGLSGHQRIVVRHADKAYDHVHVFWCTVGIETGQIPSKRWFRAANAPMAELGPRALSPEQVATLSVKQRRLKSYDAHGLTRLQHLCRTFEQQKGLRQLASPDLARAARAAGKATDRKRAQHHRSARIGDSLIQDAVAIREALDAVSWDERVAKLGAIGLGLRSATRRLKTGEEVVRGVLVYDLENHANTVAASAFDTTDRKYGLGALDNRIAADAPRYAQWLRSNTVLEPPRAKHDAVSKKSEYDVFRKAHRAAEAVKNEERRILRCRHAAERTSKRTQIMNERRQLAAHLPQNERKAFYAAFDDDVRKPCMTALVHRQRKEADSFKRKRLTSFADWRRRSLRIVADLVFPKSAPALPSKAASLHMIGTIKTIPCPHSGPDELRTKDRGSIFKQAARVHSSTGATLKARSVSDRPLGQPQPRMPQPSRSTAPEAILEFHPKRTTDARSDTHLTYGLRRVVTRQAARYVSEDGTIVFADHGSRILVFDLSRQSLTAALKLAFAQEHDHFTVRAEQRCMTHIERIAAQYGWLDRIRQAEPETSTTGIGPTIADRTKRSRNSEDTSDAEAFQTGAAMRSMPRSIAKGPPQPSLPLGVGNESEGR